MNTMVAILIGAGVIIKWVFIVYAVYKSYTNSQEIAVMNNRMNIINETFWILRARIAALEGGNQISVLKSLAKKGEDPVN